MSRKRTEDSGVEAFCPSAPTRVLLPLRLQRAPPPPTRGAAQDAPWWEATEGMSPPEGLQTPIPPDGRQRSSGRARVARAIEYALERARVDTRWRCLGRSLLRRRLFGTGYLKTAWDRDACRCPSPALPHARPCLCVCVCVCVHTQTHTHTHTGGVVVGLFADPMVDAVNGFSRASHIPAFFVAFVVTPFASNASEVF